MQVKYPERSERRTSFRTLIESAAQFNSYTAAFARFYSYTHPSEFQQAIEHYLRALGYRSNDHEEQLKQLQTLLAPRQAASDMALEIAFHMLRGDKEGRCDPQDWEKLRAAFANVPEDEFEEAIGELSHLGFAAEGFTVARPTIAMYLAFDLAATGRDTRADAVEVARLWLENEELTNIAALHERLGWDLRRLNPAVEALLHIFDEGLRGSEYCNYSASFVIIHGAERHQLRQIVKTGQVD